VEEENSSWCHFSVDDGMFAKACQVVRVERRMKVAQENCLSGRKSVSFPFCILVLMFKDNQGLIEMQIIHEVSITSETDGEIFTMLMEMKEMSVSSLTLSELLGGITPGKQERGRVSSLL